MTWACFLCGVDFIDNHSREWESSQLGDAENAWLQEYRVGVSIPFLTLLLGFSSDMAIKSIARMAPDISPVLAYTQG